MIGTPTVLNSGIQDILQYFVVPRIGIRDDQSRPKKAPSFGDSSIRLSNIR